MSAATERSVSATPVALPNYGIDADRVLATDSLFAAARRRIDGRYSIDQFGGDPHLMDLLAPIPSAFVRVEVEGADHLPRSGPALLVVNRGTGVVEPLVLGVAVRRAAGRRLRVVGAPEVPLLGPAARKLGAVGYRPDDVAAMLRAGHLAAAPLGMTWLRGGAGQAPRSLVAATLGFPVVPVAVRPGGPLNLPLRPWRVIVGAALLPPPGTTAHDQLAAAELSEQVRDAVRGLLEESP
jgi:1-acyl-sn-glycerol-3-phosphate acyltransferase